jgi:DNA-binding NarL/FixJ family response regulator
MQKKRILCVEYEGDPTYNKIAEKGLQKKGYDVVIVNPYSLGDAGTEYNLVIQLGISAREDEGIMFLESLRRMIPPGVKIIVVSGHDREIAERIKAAGAWHYIERNPKEANPDKLVDLIDRLLK